MLTFSQGRAHIFKIHARSMSVEKDIRYELLARLCPNSTGELPRSVQMFEEYIILDYHLIIKKYFACLPCDMHWQPNLIQMGEIYLLLLDSQLQHKYKNIYS